MITLTGVDQVEKRLKSLGNVVSPKLLRKLGNKVLANSKKRITAQSDLSGTAWKKRSINSDERLRRKKMLLGLRRRMRVVSATDSQVVVGFTGRAEKIAAEQQHGIKDNPHPARVSTARNARSTRVYDPTQAATKRQAIALVRLGYKVKGRAVSSKWIMAHLMWQKAGVIINIMRRNAKANGEYYLPARSFIGVNANDNQELLKIIEDELNKATQ